MTQILDKYTKPDNPGSFSGLSGFLKNNKRIGKNNAFEVLSKVDALTLHKPRLKKFPRNKFYSNGIDDIWQADLVDVKNIAGSNYKNNYILTCIDIFSKFAWAVEIKRKTAESTCDGFKRILSGKRKPNKIQIDGGNEFKGVCKRYLNDLGIELYLTESKIKAGVVERFNRTLKEKMWRMFTFHRNKKFLPYLQDLVKSYNSSYHRSIKMRPIDVDTKNEKEVFLRLFGFSSDIDDISGESFNKIEKIGFKIGDYIRIPSQKNIFDKGYTGNWGKEVFLIDKILPRVPVVFKIKDLSGDILPGVYYKEQIQKVGIKDFPFDTFQVVEEKDKQLKIVQVNNSDSDSEKEPFLVDKEKFFKSK
jgi:hypothetical protein